MPAYHSLRELYITRLREFYRQPARIFWVYVFPTILAVCLGLAFRSRPPEKVPVTVVANGNEPAILQALNSAGARGNSTGLAGIDVKVLTETEATKALRTGKTPLVLSADNQGQVTYSFDPTRPEAVSARAAVDNCLQTGMGRQDAVLTRDALVQEPGSRYIDFLIPGLMGLNTMGGGMWGVGFLLVSFRIAKLLKRFQATPMPRWHFLMALLGARLTFLIPDVVVLLLVGVYGFGMPVRGSLLLAAVVVIAGALAFAGLGLLVGSRATTTETASGLMNLVMLPMWLFSGVFFPSDRFPAAIQPVIQALPLTQLVSALRQILLEGAGVLQVAGAIGILSAWAVVTFLLALSIFRWS